MAASCPEAPILGSPIVLPNHTSVKHKAGSTLHKRVPTCTNTALCKPRSPTNGTYADLLTKGVNRSPRVIMDKLFRLSEHTCHKDSGPVPWNPRIQVHKDTVTAQTLTARYRPSISFWKEDKYGSTTIYTHSWEKTVRTTNEDDSNRQMEASTTDTAFQERTNTGWYRPKPARTKTVTKIASP